MKLAQQRSSTGEDKKVETFESLSEKQSQLTKEIGEAESDLKSAQESLSNAKSLNKQVKFLIFAHTMPFCLTKIAQARTFAERSQLLFLGWFISVD